MEVNSYLACTFLFLLCYSNEYFLAMENIAPSQDIRAKQSPEEHEGPPTDQHSQSEPEDTAADNSSSEPQDSVHKKRHRAATKSLCIHLGLFTAFKNPRALFKESELRQLFMRFLAHREGEVQKLAVKCLMTYKFDYLEPYKENIERLMDDENFRDELAHFSVDEESGIVDISHREGLIPLLIRSVVTRDILKQMIQCTEHHSSKNKGKKGINSWHQSILRTG